MRVAMYYSNSDVRVEEMPRPEISPGEILVKVMACGVCGSDVMEWYRIKKAPLVLGHELAGEIMETGEDVSDFKVGDRVVVTHHVPCNTCHYCSSGHHSVCDTLRSTTFHPGGFSEYLRVPEINVDRGTFTLPERLSYEQGAFVEPLGCAIRGLQMAGLRKDMTAVVLGSGVTGLLFLKLLKAMGVEKVITTDISEYKLGKAREFGADAAIQASEDIPEHIRELNEGRLADLVVLCSGATPAVNTTFEVVDRGGTILFFASSLPGVKIEFPLADLWKNEVKTVTSYAASPNDLTTAMMMMDFGIVEVEDMITHRFPLAETGKGFELAARSEESLKIIIKPHD